MEGCHDSRNQAKPNRVEPHPCARLLKVAINSEILYKVSNLQDPAYKREQQSLTFNYTVKELTVEQLLYEEVAKRHNFTSVFWNDSKNCFHRSGKHFKSSDLLPFDFDNSTFADDPTDPDKKIKVKYDDLRYWTIDRAIAHPFIQMYAAFIYTTASHTEDWHKFRVVFITPETITKRDTYEMLLRAGIQLFDADPQCKDSARFMYGAGENARLILLGNVMNDEAMRLLKDSYAVSLSSSEKAQKQAAREEAKKSRPAIEVKPEERSKLAQWYGERAIEIARNMINQSVQGVNRHNARRNAAILLGGYVAGGILTYTEAYNVLAEVVGMNTDNFEGAMKTVEDGLAHGQTEPITLERLEAEQAAYVGSSEQGQEQVSQESNNDEEKPDLADRRAAFQFLKQQAIEQEEKTAYDRRRCTSGDFAAVSVLTAEHGFKDKARVAIMAFLGLCAIKSSFSEFEFTYDQLYPLLRRYDPELLKRTDGKLDPKNARRINGTVRPYIKALKKAQDRAGVLFIEVQEGKKCVNEWGQDAYIKSTANFPIWEYLDEIDLAAKLNPSYSRNSKRIRLEEARKVAQNLKPYKLAPRREMTIRQQINFALKQAAGNLQKVVDLMQSPDNEYHDWAIRDLLMKNLPPKVLAILFGAENQFDTLPESQDTENQEFDESKGVDDLHFDAGESTGDATSEERNGHLRETEDIGIKSESPPSQGIPFMITQGMRERLRSLGYSPEEISKMTPMQAHERINRKKGPPPAGEEWEEELDSMTASVLTQ